MIFPYVFKGQERPYLTLLIPSLTDVGPLCRSCAPKREQIGFINEFVSHCTTSEALPWDDIDLNLYNSKRVDRERAPGPFGLEKNDFPTVL